MGTPQYLQVADDALAGIRFTLPQLGVKPRPQAPLAPATMITRHFARSPQETNRALLQAHFMQWDMFHRFFPLDGLELFFNNEELMQGQLSVSDAPPRRVSEWFLDPLDADEISGDQEKIEVRPAVFMHISQEWFLIAETMHDFVLHEDYLHCRELSWPAPSFQTQPWARHFLRCSCSDLARVQRWPAEGGRSRAISRASPPR